MTTDTAVPLDHELLLTHAAFVRGLARSLLRDEHQAEDVAQQTLAIALEKPPARTDGLRGWLATVARNLVRERGRRDVRRDVWEQRAARPEGSGAPSPEDIVAREALRRTVVEAVLQLDEPYRDVLLLRFYEELPPRRIAARLDMPVETVRTRIKRGLARLRAHLDAQHGGDRSQWMAALLPLAWPLGSLPAGVEHTDLEPDVDVDGADGSSAGGDLPRGAPGPSLPATSALFGVPAGLLAVTGLLVGLGVGVAWWLDRPATDAPADDAVMVLPDVGGESVASGDGQHASAGLDATLAVPALGADDQPPRASSLDLPARAPWIASQVRDVHGEPLAGRELFAAGVVLDDGWLPLIDQDADALAARWREQRVVADDTGLARFDDLSAGAWLIGLPASAEGPFLLAGLALIDAPFGLAGRVREHLDTQARLQGGVSALQVFELDADGGLPLDLIEPDSRVLHGVVSDPGGLVLPDAEVMLLPREALDAVSDALGLEAALAGLAPLASRATSDGQGRFALVADHGAGTLRARADDFAPAELLVAAASSNADDARDDLGPRGSVDDPLRVVVQPLELTRVSGVVRDGSGLPLPGATIWLCAEPRVPDAAALLAGELPSTTSGSDGRFAFPPLARLSSAEWTGGGLVRGGRMHVGARGPGTLPVLVPREVGDTQELELTLVPGGPFEAHLIDKATGELLEEGEVTVTPSSGGSITFLMGAFSNRAGVVTMPVLAHGPVDIAVERFGYESFATRVRFEGQPFTVEVDMPPVAWRPVIDVRDEVGVRLIDGLPAPEGLLAYDFVDVTILVEGWAAEPTAVLRAQIARGGVPVARPVVRGAGLSAEGGFVLPVPESFRGDTLWVSVRTADELLEVVRLQRGEQGLRVDVDTRGVTAGLNSLAVRMLDGVTGRTLDGMAYLQDPRTGAVLDVLGWDEGEWQADLLTLTGRYDLVVNSDGRAEVVRPVELRAGERQEVTVTLQPEARLDLRWEPGEEPERLILRDPSTGWRYHGPNVPGSTSRRGEHVLMPYGALPEGPVEVLAVRDGRMARGVVSLVVGERAELVLEWQPAPVVDVFLGGELALAWREGALGVRDGSGALVSTWEFGADEALELATEGRGLTLVPGRYEVELNGLGLERRAWTLDVTSAEGQVLTLE